MDCATFNYRPLWVSGCLSPRPLHTGCRSCSWLVLSDGTRTLRSLCQPATDDAVHALCCTYQKHGDVETSAVDCCVQTEVVACQPHHLHALLTACRSDHLFVAQAGSADTPECLYRDAGQLGRYAYLSSMVWAYTAAALAGLRCKTSLLTQGSKAIFTDSDNQIFKSESPPVTDLEFSLLPCLAHGVGKTLFMESRAHYGTAIDLSGGDRLSARQLMWLAAHSGEYAVTMRDGRVLGERLAKSALAARGEEPTQAIRLQSAAACVVSGGTKGLGLELARHLVYRGCRFLVLTSRTGDIDPIALGRINRAGAHHLG